MIRRSWQAHVNAMRQHHGILAKEATQTRALIANLPGSYTRMHATPTSTPIHRMTAAKGRRKTFSDIVKDAVFYGSLQARLNGKSPASN